MKILYILFNLFSLVNSRGSCYTTGTVLFFGKNFQHSVIVSNKLFDKYKYFPNIKNIHSTDNTEKYIICIHKVPKNNKSHMSPAIFNN